MKKKKCIVLIIITLLIILLVCAISYILYWNKMLSSISLLKDNIIIEYGEKYVPTIETLIDLEKYNFIKKDDVEIISELKNEDGKDYAKVGEYSITLKYKNKVFIQKVEIKDTTKPEIEIKDNIEIANNTDLSTFDFKQFVNITDLSEIKKCEFDYSKVDVSKSGKYIVKVYVEDVYNNKNEKEFEVTVPEIAKHETIANNIKQSKSNDNVKKKENSTRTEQKSQPSKQKENNSTKENQASNEQQKVWCDEGGKKHWQGSGVNEHGYYKTWDEAWKALQSYMKDFESGNYAVRQCPCGLYYFWVKED